MRTWKVLACERVRLLKRQIARLEKPPHLAPQCKHADLDARKSELQQVEDLIAQPRSSLADWWSGDRINEVWVRLHDVEEALDEMTPDDQLDNLAWIARRHITDERPANPDTLRAAIDDAEGAQQAWWRRRKEPIQVQRAAMAAIAASHGAANLRHLNERRLRRASYGWGLGLLLAAACLVGVQAFFDDTVVPRPEGSLLTPWVLLTLICVFAALGAVLSAMVSLYLNPDLSSLRG